MHLHYVHCLLLLLFCQVLRDVLAPPGTKRRKLHKNEIRNDPTSIVQVLSGGTYGLPGSSFVSRLTLLPTVPSAALRAAVALLSSLTLHSRFAALSVRCYSRLETQEDEVHVTVGPLDPG